MKIILRLLAVVIPVVLVAACGGGGGGAAPPAGYTVSYGGNGNTSGSVPVDLNRYQPGQAVTVLANTGGLLKTGSTFTGWNTQADGLGTLYVSSQTFTIGAANVVLYAKWTLDPWCGDSITNGTEQCDDGNAVETDGCTSTCRLAEVCDAATYPGGDRFGVSQATGNCYVSFDDDQTTYASALSSCASISGHLVTITTSTEQATVSSVQNPAQNPWIGAIDDGNDTDTVFVWTTAETWAYTNFAAGEPDDDNGAGGNGECLFLMNTAGEWGDTNCAFVGFVTGRICEMEYTP